MANRSAQGEPGTMGGRHCSRNRSKQKNDEEDKEEERDKEDGEDGEEHEEAKGEREGVDMEGYHRDQPM
jgi:hypothetical protein